MVAPKRHGILFVVSAASGTGKTTLIHRAITRLTGVALSVSHTTRPPRQGEEDGRDYHFVPLHEFNAMIRRNEFLEWAEVYGHRYGTSVKMVEEKLLAGTDVILEIDVQGAAQVRERMPLCRQIFVFPPSMSELENRIRKRGRDDEEEIARRLASAKDEIKQAVYYDYFIVNDDLERAVRSFVGIVLAERCRRENRPDIIEKWDLDTSVLKSGRGVGSRKKKGRSLVERLLGF